MKLEDLLSQKKSSILKKWFHLVIETYPAETSRFLIKQTDQFANPVGHTISQGLEAFYEELLVRSAPDKISPFIDALIRVRAIQDFSPSQAIAFIFLLKKVLREELEKEIQERQNFEELLIIESRIDELALRSFELYMKCREKLYELRATEVKNRYFRLLERAQLICSIPEDEKDLTKGTDDTPSNAR